MLEIENLRTLSSKLSVLYVEDDQMLLDITIELLESLFNYVDYAHNGKKALVVYEDYYLEHSSYFDLVISDIEMPCMNGITLSKELFKQNKLQKILITSAYDDKKYLIELIHIGVSGFIQKPLVDKQLYSALLGICKELTEEKEAFRFLTLNKDFTWDHKLKILYSNNVEVKLSSHEKALFGLLLDNLGSSFTSLELFEKIYSDERDKTFSQDSIRSLIKRLRKKLPNNLILNTPYLGYKINL